MQREVDNTNTRRIGFHERSDLCDCMHKMSMTVRQHNRDMQNLQTSETIVADPIKNREERNNKMTTAWNHEGG